MTSTVALRALFVASTSSGATSVTTTFNAAGTGVVSAMPGNVTET